MAKYKIHKKQKSSNPNAKKIAGIVLIALSCLAFFFLLTNLVGFMQDFLLGTFGYFAYILFILLFLLGVGLLNNKKYKLAKKYAIFLYLTVFFLFCIIQLAVVGDKAGSFGEYLATNYTQKHTAGGIIFGLFTTCILYLTNFAWAFVIFSIAFVICLALYIDALIFLKRKQNQEKPVKLNIKEVKREQAEKQQINVVMSGNVEQKLSRTEEIKQKLGLSKRALNQPIVQTEKPQAPKKVDPKQLQGDDLKKYLLTPPEVDINTYFSQDARSYARNGITSQPFRQEIDANIQNLKQQTLPQTNVSEVASAQPEQLVSEADDIIKEVLQENNIIASDQAQQETNQNQPSSRDFDRRDRDFESRDRDLDRRDRDLDRRDRDLDRRDRNFDRQPSHDETISPKREELSRDGNFSVPQPPQNQEGSKRFVDIDGDDQPQEQPPYHYTRPPIDLITTQSTNMSEFDDNIAEKTGLLEHTLEDFGVPAKVQNVVIGPAVTRYELEMPTGITVKKILNLSSDIALALEANGGDVRIEAPVPGRNVVGVEVPNDKVAMVSLKDVIVSNEFNNAKSPLSFAVGKDITGRIMVGALNKMPHLLIAGTTGSGKSVMLNSIIISLLYKTSPEDCKLLLIDPKQVEFMPYEGIPHLIVPKVISDINKASNALQWATDEMERRFRLIREARVKDIDEYNFTPEVVSGKKKKMPFIVVIIDEFSDFIMQGKKEVEDKIIRLGQKARAAGIHLILATQYPTAEYVTGGIKANFPSRIAFKVASRVNSDVILGMTGAEKLLGHGDMLYAPQEYSSAPKRVQGCFITTREIADIVNYVTLNNEPIFDKEIQDAINNMPKNNAGEFGDKGGMDPLLPDALKICIDAGQASVSMIQRRLAIGYPRAGKIVDQMTEMGYISVADGAKPRNVYITLEEYYQIFGENYE